MSRIGCPSSGLKRVQWRSQKSKECYPTVQRCYVNSNHIVITERGWDSAPHGKGGGNWGKVGKGFPERSFLFASSKLDLKKVLLKL